VKHKFNIVFFGTPAFAVPTLQALHRSEHTVALVVTQPDRRKGRGRKRLPPPVKLAAEASNYPIIQPEKLHAPESIERLAAVKADFFVLVAFGQILKRSSLEMPSLGAINVHASLLPKYRGAAPIQWALINDEVETGVTTMLMDESLDGGDILLSAATPITPADDAAALHDRVSTLGADVLIDTLDQWRAGTLVATPQNDALASYAPRLKKGDGRINWEISAAQVAAFIRGMTPWPAAFTFHNDRQLKILKAQPLAIATQAAPGTVLQSFPGELRIATGKGVLSILEIQAAGGKKLPIDEFLRGHTISPGTALA
jgi:methionyl-tRNA formyltransferase